MFRSIHFSFLVFGHFWGCSYGNRKILRNICLHFARQDRQEGKNRKENHTTKVTKNQKTKIWLEFEYSIKKIPFKTCNTKL